MSWRSAPLVAAHSGSGHTPRLARFVISAEDIEDDGAKAAAETATGDPHAIAASSALSGRVRRAGIIYYLRTKHVDRSRGHNRFIRSSSKDQSGHINGTKDCEGNGCRAADAVRGQAREVVWAGRFGDQSAATHVLADGSCSGIGPGSDH